MSRESRIGKLPAFRFGNVDEGDLGTLPGKALDDRCADAGAAARHQHAAIFEFRKLRDYVRHRIVSRCSIIWN